MTLNIHLNVGRRAMSRVNEGIPNVGMSEPFNLKMQLSWSGRIEGGTMLICVPVSIGKQKEVDLSRI